MQKDEEERYVGTLRQVKHNLCSSVQYQLQRSDGSRWEAKQERIAVVQSECHYGLDKKLGRDCTLEPKVEMWNSVMLCWWVLHGIQLAAGAVHGNVPLEDTELLRAVKESAFLSNTGKGSFSRLEPERIGTVTDEEVMMDSTGLYDEEEDVSEAVQLQTRAVRSPRRCFRHQESCLGHQLPCCDPCDTCYCRFFNAICYCRRISQACLHGRH
ncbi:Agouti-related peptide 1-like [Scleropages formosus]|uniref:Agouti-related protein n=2 Tax=Scleropages formosus TaxID=113540 RepID=A0A0P7UE49_SCLFO|nr:Agouti-related peptide 1-like [Scleropages formosus]